jgi:hypothetical protein
MAILVGCLKGSSLFGLNRKFFVQTAFQISPARHKHHSPRTETKMDKKLASFCWLKRALRKGGQFAPFQK